jgi:hypothetical protein
MQVESGNDRLRSSVRYIHTSQLRDEVGVLHQDATLERITLLAQHRGNVERITLCCLI